jgi:hypothetical protein
MFLQPRANARTFTNGILCYKSLLPFLVMLFQELHDTNITVTNNAGTTETQFGKVSGMDKTEYLRNQ